jgi:RNA polymerase sigma-70 factor (ECF subfamily)
VDSELPAGDDAPLDEPRLVRALVAGDRQAFDRFAEAYIPALYRFAASRLRRHPELTRDVVQATLTRAIEKLPSFRGEAALMTWLCTCCTNEIAAHFRRQRRAAEVAWSQVLEPTAPGGPDDDSLREERTRLVHTALDLLPPRHSRALEWKYLDDLPVREIADRLQLGLKAAESLLTRARAAFRETFARLQVGHHDDRT